MSKHVFIAIASLMLVTSIVIANIRNAATADSTTFQQRVTVIDPIEARQNGPWNVGLNGNPGVTIANIPTVNVGNFPKFPSALSHARQNWEYRVFEQPVAVTSPSASAIALQNRLNELGADGWEFAAGSQGVVILKRPLR